MIKHFCDCCGALITDKTRFNFVRPSHETGLPVEHFKLIANSGTIVYQGGIMIKHIFGAPEPDVCKYCVIDAIKELDDRPKQADYSEAAKN